MTGENRTLVDWFTASRLNHSATATPGAGGANRTLMIGFSDRRHDHVGDPGKIGGEPGSRTPTGWMQAIRAPVITSHPGTSPQKPGTGRLNRTIVARLSGVGSAIELGRSAGAEGDT